MYIGASSPFCIARKKMCSCWHAIFLSGNTLLKMKLKKQEQQQKNQTKSAHTDLTSFSSASQFKIYFFHPGKGWKTLSARRFQYEPSVRSRSWTRARGGLCPHRDPPRATARASSRIGRHSHPKRHFGVFYGSLVEISEKLTIYLQRTRAERLLKNLLIFI